MENQESPLSFGSGVEDDRTNNLIEIPLQLVERLPFSQTSSSQDYLEEGTNALPFLSIANIQFENSDEPQQFFGSDSMSWIVLQDNDNVYLRPTTTVCEPGVDFSQPDLLTSFPPTLQVTSENNIASSEEVIPVLESVSVNNGDLIILQSDGGPPVLFEVSPDTSAEEMMPVEENLAPIITIPTVRNDETSEGHAKQVIVLLDVVDESLLLSPHGPISISTTNEQETTDKSVIINQTPTTTTPTVVSAEPGQTGRQRGRPRKKAVEDRVAGRNTKKRPPVSLGDEIPFEKLVKIRPAQVKSQRKAVPDDQKDEKYHARRMKNTLSAKRCRDFKKRLDAARQATKSDLLAKIAALRARKEELERLTANYDKDVRECEFYKKLAARVVEESRRREAKESERKN